MSRSAVWRLLAPVLLLLLLSPGSACAYVYWTGNTGTTIGRVDLDGSGENASFISGASEPLSVAVDGQQILWANRGDGTIGVANLDGSGVDQQLVSGGDVVAGVAFDGAYIMWSNYGSNTIGRANSDGSDADQSFITGVPAPAQLAVVGSFVYWAGVSGSIGRANLDGSDVDPDFITGASTPYGVVVTGGFIYWSNYATGTIGRANLDGSDVEEDFITGALYPLQLASDGTYLYWANHGAGAIGRARLDGSDVEQDYITGTADAYGLAVDAGAPPAPAIRFGRARSSGATASLPVACGPSAPCTGSVSITARGKHRRVTVASGRFALAAGASAVEHVRLNRSGRRMLERTYHLATTLSVSGTGTLSAPLRFAWPRIRLRLEYRWSTSGATTTVSQLTLGRVPARARVILRCSGGGCPLRARRLHHRHGTIRIAPLFRHTALIAGAQIEVEVTEAGHVGDVLRFVARSGALPDFRDDCLVPGDRVARTCPRA